MLMKICPTCKKPVAAWLKSKMHGYCRACRNSKKRLSLRRVIKNNPDFYKDKYKKNAEDRRKFRIRQLTSTFNNRLGHKVDQIFIKDWIQQFEFSPCIYCRKSMTYDDMSLDHILPKSRGGTDDEENLQIVHKVCNQMKGMLTHEEYIRLLKFCKRNKELGDIVLLRLRQSGYVYKRR